MRNTRPFLLQSSGGWLLVLFIVSAMPCAAQRESEFLGVRSWQGNLRLKANHAGTNSAGGGTDTWDFQWSADLQFKLDEFVAGGQYWRGKFTGGSAAVRHKNVYSAGNCTITTTLTGQGLPTDPEFFLYVGPGNNYALAVSGHSIPASVTATTVCSGQTAVQTNNRPEGWFASDLHRNVVFALPVAGLDLIGGGGFPIGLPMPLFTMLLGAAPTLLADVSWEFRGAASPLEVIVEPRGYDNWRPEAAMDEATPGNDISVKATLRHEDGSPPSENERAQKFEFELTNVSKEPGITMNYPLAGKAKNTLDLQFDETRNGGLPVILHGPGQAESFGLPHETASILVSAYDWGAWGEIKVTAVLRDGRRIVGYLKGEKNHTPVRLPKRASDSFIADGWKTSKGASSAPDNDDKEKEPQGEAGCDGDGLTVYEEYRGFIENGAHIEGNVDKKDFFILNLIGGDAEPGIWLFTDITQLEVHKDLKEDELSQEDTQINANCDKCPQRVAQHGVYMEEIEDLSGGVTSIRPYGNFLTRGRPGLTRSIAMQPRMAAGSMTNPNNLSNLDKPLLYDVSVAHELSHSVGLDHHGEGDSDRYFELIIPENPANTLGRAYIAGPGGNPVTLLDEATGVDAIGRLYGAYLSAGEYIQGRLDSGSPLDSESQLNLETAALTSNYQVGLPSRQHSGAVECVMRYSYASMYPKQQSPDEAFYLVPPGTEPLGFQLCDTAEGTGINKDPRTPQPRYFGAAANRGTCRKDVCVNDAIPPRKAN